MPEGVKVFFLQQPLGRYFINGRKYIARTFDEICAYNVYLFRWCCVTFYQVWSKISIAKKWKQKEPLAVWAFFLLGKRYASGEISTKWLKLQPFVFAIHIVYLLWTLSTPNGGGDGEEVCICNSQWAIIFPNQRDHNQEAGEEAVDPVGAWKWKNWSANRRKDKEGNKLSLCRRRLLTEGAK